MPFETLATDAQIEEVRQNVTERGIQTEVLENGAAALARLQELIPAQASVFTASSETLKQIGFESLLQSGNHPWNNLKDEVLAAPREQLYDLRRQATLADFSLASVQAVCETGEILIASHSGSQLPASAFSSPNVVWVVGTQKIVPTLEEGLRRVREYCLPKTDVAIKSMGGRGSFIGKLLIFEREVPHLRRNIHLLLVKELVGF